MRNEEFDLEDLKKYYPDPSTMGDLSDYDLFVFKNNISVGKVIESNKLTLEEKRTLCEKLNEEWLETVVKPYIRTLYDFCVKYEIALMKSRISLEAAPLMKFALQEMLDEGLGKLNDLLDRD